VSRLSFTKNYYTTLLYSVATTKSVGGYNSQSYYTIKPYNLFHFLNYSLEFTFVKHKR